VYCDKDAKFKTPSGNRGTINMMGLTLAHLALRADQISDHPDRPAMVDDDHANHPLLSLCWGNQMFRL
jgi:hypothetical protein